MPSHQQDQTVLDAHHAEIERLRIEVDRAERKAGELLDGEHEAARAGARVVATRMLLEAAKDKYIATSEAARKRRGTIHGEALTPVCADCVDAARFIATRVA